MLLYERLMNEECMENAKRIVWFLKKVRKRKVIKMSIVRLRRRLSWTKIDFVTKMIVRLK